jgi:protein TonB
MHNAPSAPLPLLPAGFSLPRSVAIAAAVTLHLSLAAMLAMPLASPETERPESTPVPIDWITPKPPPPIAPPPPPIERVVVPPRPVAPAPVPVPVPVPLVPVPEPIAAPNVETPSPFDTYAPAVDAAPGDIDAGPAEDILQLRSGTPPRYPPAALSRRLEGEVELLILVGIDGRPESVTVTRSSGHTLLDRAAREHVLRRWTFEPSLRNGIAVPAYARVPVRFTLP